ncbi:hypothetical protein FACS189499_10090 [Clostridia bacterium]|nr:hypothetical protein FACS189499_10090 [Clostridia bacterium]
MVAMLELTDNVSGIAMLELTDNVSDIAMRAVPVREITDNYCNAGSPGAEKHR